MTRINTVPVQTLTDKHLLAEYKEITRPFNKVLKRIENGTTNDVVIPDSYVMGTGHETFFFNKLKWLWNRYKELASELVMRDFDIDLHKYSVIAKKFYDELHKHEWWNNWRPTPEDMYLNMARLVKRSNIEKAIDEIRSTK